MTSTSIETNATAVSQKRQNALESGASKGVMTSGSSLTESLKMSTLGEDQVVLSATPATMQPTRQTSAPDTKVSAEEKKAEVSDKKSEASKPDASKPDAVKADSVKPDSSKPDAAAKPNAFEKAGTGTDVVLKTDAAGKPSSSGEPEENPYRRSMGFQRPIETVTQAYIRDTSSSSVVYVEQERAPAAKVSESNVSNTQAIELEVDPISGKPKTVEEYLNEVRVESVALSGQVTKEDIGFQLEAIEDEIARIDYLDSTFGYSDDRSRMREQLMKQFSSVRTLSGRMKNEERVIQEPESVTPDQASAVVNTQRQVPGPFGRLDARV